MCRKEGPSRLESISRLRLSYARICKVFGPGLDTSPLLIKFRPCSGRHQRNVQRERAYSPQRTSRTDPCARPCESRRLFRGFI